MSQFPRFVFGPLRQTRLFSSRFRHQLALSMALLLLLASFSQKASAHPQGSAPDDDLVVAPGGSSAFVIYQREDGATVCREATPAEKQEMSRRDARGLRQINHLQPEVYGPEASGADAAAATGLKIILRGTAQLENFPEAKAAFIRAAATWEAQIQNDITITIDVDYGPTNFGQPYGTNVLGSTSDQSIGNFTNYYTSVVRPRLIQSASSPEEVALYNQLPASTIPNNLGNTAGMIVATPILRALGAIASVASDTEPYGAAPKIGFNSNFQYDFDPSNGIDSTKTDFDAVAVHEIGHVLGFLSFAGYRELDASNPNFLAMWDLFRFAPGVSLGTFSTAQRFLSSGDTPSGNPVYFAGSAPLLVSTGRPDGTGGDGEQSSHWKDDLGNTANYIGIMDPTINRGRRQTITANDLRALDFFGYRVGSAAAQTLQLSQPSYTVNESAKFATINVTRTGDTSTAATVKYSTSDATDVNFQCNPSTPGQPTGAASRKCDYHLAAGRLRFAPGETSKQIVLSVIDDVYVEAPETLTVTLSNPTGASLGAPSSATVTITDNDFPGAANPIDATAFYVRQLYVDLLSREPDPAGQQGWINRIDLCGQPGQAPPPCDRVTVGGDGFLRSAEFFDRQFFVIRLYRAGLGRIPRYDDIGDLAYVSGFLSDADLEMNKQELVAEIMSRSEFGNIYNGLSNSSYVNTLVATAAVTIPQSVRDGWVTALNNSTKTRAQVYRELSERAEVSNRYLHEAQVISCYYGFFTRNPDAAYLNYLSRLDSGQINLGDLANAFINAAEYRQRFGF